MKTIYNFIIGLSTAIVILSLSSPAFAGTKIGNSSGSELSISGYNYTFISSVKRTSNLSGITSSISKPVFGLYSSPLKTPSIFAANADSERKGRKNTGLLFSIGICGSGDYYNVMSSQFSGDLSGNFNWLNLELGMDFRVYRNLFLEPKLMWFSHEIKSKDMLGMSNSAAVSDIVLPGINAKYYVYQGKSASGNADDLSVGAYLTAGMYMNLPGTDLEDVKYESGGPAKNLSVGLYVQRSIVYMNFELGTMSIPVKVTTYSIDSYGMNTVPSTGSLNFGGFFLNLKAGFYLSKN